MIFKELEKNNKDIFSTNPKIILGLSGGPDSIFLYEFLKELHKKNKIKLICAHFDHEWRRESAKDSEFCKKLCMKDNIEFIQGRSSELNLSIKFNGSKEEIGRIMRHTFLKKILINKNANYIALAHHLKDQQETFIWRIIRGTTLSGLTCMKEIDAPYIRPLLNMDKKEILDYLDNNNIDYLTDHTNESDDYLRNRIRKYVIPAIEKCDDRFNKKFATTLNLLQEEEEFLKNITLTNFNNIFKLSSKNNKFIGDLKGFKSLDKILQKRILILLFCKKNLKFNLSNNYLNEILRFIKNTNGGSHQISTNFKIIKKQNNFWVE
ncbi:MAG: tRNA lysidine(34) synthetase TilS [bacterium]